jgi:hypothetical protein
MPHRLKDGKMKGKSAGHGSTLIKPTGQRKRAFPPTRCLGHGPQGRAWPRRRSGILIVEFVDESPYVLGSPYGCARAELDGLGKTARFAAFPPCRAAHGKNAEDLPDAEIAGRGNGAYEHGLTDGHKKPP